MGFTSDVKGKVIRDYVSHKLEIPMASPSNKVWNHITTVSHLKIGDPLRYTKKVHNELVDMVAINIRAGYYMLKVHNKFFVTTI